MCIVCPHFYILESLVLFCRLARHQSVVSWLSDTAAASILLVTAVESAKQSSLKLKFHLGKEATWNRPPRKWKRYRGTIYLWSKTRNWFGSVSRGMRALMGRWPNQTSWKSALVSGVNWTKTLKNRPCNVAKQLHICERRRFEVIKLGTREQATYFYRTSRAFEPPNKTVKTYHLERYVLIVMTT